MEVLRAKNVATRIVFPIVDADGDLVTGAAGLDSEIDQWTDGANPTGFADCTNEATEIGSTGIYYLNLTQTEMNEDYIAVQIKTSTTGAKTQVILINTTPQTSINTVDDFLDTEIASIISKVDVIDDFLDTEVAAIKAKTDNLPSDPADASDIAASFTTVNSKLDAIDDFLDSEIAAILADTNELQTDLADGGRLDLLIDAIKAKTDNLPSDPADASVIAGLISGIESKIDTIDDFLDSEVAAILADTNELQTDWANGGRLDLLIDAIKAKTDNLPSDPADQSALETLLNAIDDFLDTEIAAIKAKTDNLPASPASTGDVLTQVNAALDAASTQLSSVPTTTGSLRQFIQFLHAYFRNKKTQTSSTETLYKEDAATSLGTSTLSDDGTTASKGEMN